MKTLFTDDPKLSSFSQRLLNSNFDPTAIRPIVSPATQAKPKLLPSIEGAPFQQFSPPPPPTVRIASPIGTLPNSPKRPLPLDNDSEANRPRKLARGESPLAGAAGRRLNQMRQGQHPLGNTPTTQNGAYIPPPPPLPRNISFLLTIIPPASTYNTVPFRVDKMIELIRDTPLPASESQIPTHAAVLANSARVQTGLPAPPHFAQGTPQGYYPGKRYSAT